MKTTNIKIVSASSSSTATVSAPVIGDEYVLVKASSSSDCKKEQKQPDPMSETTIIGLQSANGSSFSRTGGRLGMCSARLVYDFSITPSTSSTMQTVVALAPVQDTAFTSYWKNLFDNMRMRSAEVQLDFTQFISTVGHDVALSPVVLGFSPLAKASTQYYADVSDWKNARFAAYSQMKPVVRYKIPGKMLVAWNTGQEASVVGSYLSKWAPTQYTSATLLMGFLHVASQKIMFDTERTIVGRLIMNMTFKGQL